MCYFAGHLGAVELGHGRLCRVAAAGVTPPGGLIEKGPRVPDAGGHVGELERHTLERADRASELPALLRVGKRRLECPLRGAEAHGRNAKPAGVERIECRLEPGTTGAQ